MQNKIGKAEIISIGDELLIGQVVNTNASWMAEQLSDSGLCLCRIITIGDEPDQLSQALAESISRAQFVLLTGGLGPTADDVTKPALCDFFGTQLVFHEPTLKHVEALFKKRGFPMTDRNRQQAWLPEACIPLTNSVGTAPGMWFEKDDSVMKSLMELEVLPRFKAIFSEMHYLRKTIMTSGVGESFLADKIKDWEEQLPRFLKLAYLPQPGIVRLRLSGRHPDKTLLKQTLEEQTEKLLQLIPDLVFGYDDEPLEAAIGRLLLENQASLSTAESCTGGYIAHLLTSIPGSSAYFKGSIVAYDNQVKTKQLDVSLSDLEQYGAVSQQVVEQMARGAREKLQTTYSLATSGIAGPDGGAEEKPVGTVWIAIAGPDFVKSELFHFGEHRGRTIRRSALTALEILRKELIK
jgi:nicotinamide-nucleotide amidase